MGRLGTSVASMLVCNQHAERPSILDAMPCKSCGSPSLCTFGGEVAIHFRGLADIDRPVVWVFPEIVVCLDCGIAYFLIPDAELQRLTESDSGRANSG
jgi:hypothetical protein